MLVARVCFLLVVLPSANLHLQVNLHLTEWPDEIDHVSHDCLHVAARATLESDPRQVIPYCMHEWPSRFPINGTDLESKVTFAQLVKQRVTTEQLYQWSAPIDLLEKYQIHLEQLAHATYTPFANEVFYNCTSPYFGPKCQYTLVNVSMNRSSLNEIVHEYYRYHLYGPNILTCYVHLQCWRGPAPACLDWSEICDGKVDCLDDGEDERHCWQLEVLQCDDDEFKCSYGQCIPKSLAQDPTRAPDCLDRADEHFVWPLTLGKKPFFTREPTFAHEDISCVAYSNRGTLSRDILTSSCQADRETLLAKAFFSAKPNALNETCWSVMKCAMQVPTSSEIPCGKLYNKMTFIDMVKKNCPKIMIVPAHPILYGHIYLAYDQAGLQYSANSLQPTHVCYDDRRIDVPDDGKTFRLDSVNQTCRRFPDSTVDGTDSGEARWLQRYVSPLERWLYRIKPPMDSSFAFCNQSNMYQCQNSPKCISTARLVDATIDCPKEDDEDAEALIANTDFINHLPHFVRCPNTEQYIHLMQMNDQMMCHCTTPGAGYCADEDTGELYFGRSISFQTVCDQVLHLHPEFTAGGNDTDETDCEHWPALHVYNRCDGFWHFLNGSDEVNCDPEFALLNCSEDNHVCVSSKTKHLMCLPIEKANDGTVDCLGAADEPTLCDRTAIGEANNEVFYCEDSGAWPCIRDNQLCNNRYECDHKEDEDVCQRTDLPEPGETIGICQNQYEAHGSDIAKALCRLFVHRGNPSSIYFTLDRSADVVGQPSQPGHFTVDVNTDAVVETNAPYQQRCHRGLSLQVWLDKRTNATRDACLCPPSFYGDTCQYQNQRVSLTVQFRATGNSIGTPFVIVFSLIDDGEERRVHSAEQFHYQFIKHCQKKFNFYLLYATRPKDMTRNYSVHVDIYETRTLTYRASFLQAVSHSFLPVHRLVRQFDIPHSPEEMIACSERQCMHGRCMRYAADRDNRTFCQCDRGWSGQHCTTAHTCACSSESLCLGQLANSRSLCVCPWNKLGPRCLLDDYICRANGQAACLNGGQCLTTDEHEVSAKRFTCLCREGFFGERCESVRTKLVITFDRTPEFHTLAFVHFIEVKVNDFPARTTVVKRLSMEQKSITIYRSLPFHLAFLELTNKNYYLLVAQQKYRPPAIIERTVTSSDRCLNITDVLDRTQLSYPLLRRIKSYHLPCQIHPLLRCFYDEQHLCFCQQLEQQRVSNCFNFNHHAQTSCVAKDDCANEGQCYQEDTPCPKYFFCSCPVCYYGKRCELNTNGFSLSLDAILGFYIRPAISMTQQPRTVLLSVVVSIIIVLVGFTNGILSLITFQNKRLRTSGCGIYLLCSSVVTLLTMLTFTVKFWILVSAQIGAFSSSSWLKAQCMSLDFALRVCLTMEQWLTASVSIERALIAVKGVTFSTKKTQIIAKYVTFALFALILVGNLHDPLHRRLHEEDGDEHTRVLCIVNYRPAVRTLDYTVHSVSLLAPFLVNIICTSAIVVSQTRQRKNVQKQKSYRSIFVEQIQLHKSLLMGPFILILLAIPRLIITFASGCMRSSKNSWLFLTGYFISLIPPILTFVLFVLPSTVYKQEFRKAMSHYRALFK